MAKTNPHKGSSFDDFLKQDGIYDDVTRLARRKELAWQLEEAKAQVKRLAADYKLAKQVADSMTSRLSVAA